MADSNTIEVLIADDQAEGLKALQIALMNRAGIKVCGVALGGEELILKAGRLQPDVVITDIRMPAADRSLPATDGMEATTIIKELYPKIKIIAFTQFDTGALVVGMIKAGVDGYLLKDCGAGIIEAAIRSVVDDQPFFCAGTKRQLMAMVKNGQLSNKAHQMPPGFFARYEKEMLLLICESKTNKEIAATLYLSYNTIVKYRKRLMVKTHSRRSTDLVLFAIEKGLYKPVI